MSTPVRRISCLALALAFVQQAGASAQPTKGGFSFLVAGHAYGSHHEKNPALHTPFLERLTRLDLSEFEFLILTGDFLRYCNETSWATLTIQLEDLQIPVYLVMGNHEATAFCRERIEARHGRSYYLFDHSNTRLIVLDSQEQERSIAPNQLEFLKDALADAPGIRNVFIFFHEVLWLAEKPRYAEIRANSRSRQRNLASSNYWKDVHPLLEASPDRSFFVIAGDVGGNPDAIAAFWDRIDNVTLIASGMGEVEDENLLTVTVGAGAPEFGLVPLRDGVELEELDAYGVDKLRYLARQYDRRRDDPGPWTKRTALVAFALLILGAAPYAVRKALTRE